MNPVAVPPVWASEEDEIVYPDRRLIAWAFTPSPGTDLLPHSVHEA